MFNSQALDVFAALVILAAPEPAPPAPSADTGSLVEALDDLDVVLADYAPPALQPVSVPTELEPRPIYQIISDATVTSEALLRADPSPEIRRMADLMTELRAAYDREQQAEMERLIDLLGD